MEAHLFLLQLALILVAARILGELALMGGLPPVIGELLAGVLLGPSLLGWIEPGETLQMLAEIGVIMLLFEVGLDADINRLVHAGGQSLIVAIGGFVLPFLLGFAVCRYAFDFEPLPSLMVGGTLTATSIGITVRVLTDLGRRHSTEGQIILGAAVLDDVMGVMLLSVLYDFSQHGHISGAHLLRIGAFIGLFFVLAPVAAKLISHMIDVFHRRHDTPGLIPTTMVALVLSFAGLAHFVGAPELLGGFAAGLALSRRFFLPFGIALAADHHFSDLILSQMKPIVRLFTPIFFVMVGLSLDLRIVDWGSSQTWVISLALLAVAIAGKFGGALCVFQSANTRVAIGMGMVPRGEVGLVFAELSRVTGMLDPGTYAILMLVIAYTTLLAPFWIKSFYKRHADGMELSISEPGHQYVGPAGSTIGPGPVRD